MIVDERGLDQGGFDQDLEGLDERLADRGLVLRDAEPRERGVGVGDRGERREIHPATFADRIDHARQFQQRMGAHPAKHLAAVGLDGVDAGAQTVGDLLVHQAGDHQLAYLALLGREGIEELPGLLKR